MDIPGNSLTYARDLCTIADALDEGRITPEEFREKMAALRDRELEFQRKQQERQGQEH